MPNSITWRCTCSVYDDPEKRFTMRGCGKYFEKFGGIDYDPFPFGTTVGDQILAWPVTRCSDGNWRPEGIEECSFTLKNDTVLQLLARGLIFIDPQTGYLRDTRTKYYPVLPKKIWDTVECNQCGVCCLFPRSKTIGGGPCQYLQVEQSDIPDRKEQLEARAVKYAKKDKTGRFSKDGKTFLKG